MKYYKSAKPGTYRDVSGFEAPLSENGTMNTAKISNLLANCNSQLEFNNPFNKSCNPLIL